MIHIPGMLMVGARCKADGKTTFTCSLIEKFSSQHDIVGDEAFQVIEAGTCVKGDVLTTAKVAAIQAAKSTSVLIPMCHPVIIEAVDVDFVQDKHEKPSL